LSWAATELEDVGCATAGTQLRRAAKVAMIWQSDFIVAARFLNSIGHYRLEGERMLCCAGLVVWRRAEIVIVDLMGWR
jgi:hypothetical protein